MFNLKKKFAAFTVALMACMGLPLLAEDATATLPDLGWNVSDYLSQAITYLGGPLKICVGLAFVMIVIWVVVKFFKRGSK